MLKASVITIIFTLAAAVEGYTQETCRRIQPAATDSAITDWLEDHYVCVSSSVTEWRQLFVHFAGSFGKPGNSLLILKEAANQGYPAIGLRYPNNWTVAGLCRHSPNPNCHETVRLEILDGVDRTDLVTVTPGNSITNRLVKLLQNLDERYPEEDWGRFLNAQGTEPLWTMMIVSGHSQGGGEAALIAKHHEVHRVVMFASPADWVGAGPAPWVLGPHVTPSERYYGFAHVRDSGWRRQRTNWQTLGLEALGEPVSVDGNSPPYAHSHQLYTDALPATGNFGDAHGSVVVDRKTPLEPDGNPRFASVWRYLCCP